MSGLGHWLFVAMSAGYGLALAAYAAAAASERRWVARSATGLAAVSLAAHTLWLSVRWYQAGALEVAAREAIGERLQGWALLWAWVGHPPFTNLFESLVFVAWCLMAAWLVVEARFKLRLLGVVATMLVLVALVQAHISSEKALEPLVPALQSWWMLIHVALLFVAYALFLLAAAIAVLYLLKAGARPASMGLAASGAGAAVLALTGGRALWTRLTFELTPVYQAAGGRWRPVYYFPHGAQEAVPWAVPVPGAGPLLLLAVVLLVVSAAAFGLELRRVGLGAGLAGTAALVATLALMLVRVLGGGEFAPASLDGTLPVQIAPPFRFALTSNHGFGLLVLVAGALAACLALLAFQDRAMAGLPAAERLDEVTYKLIVIAFPMLSFGIVMGAFWAYDAWGRYWGWDPKETWSLVTWFVYALYLHARVRMGWTGKPGAAIAVLGFALVIFTYLGVNLGLTGGGLHTYGSG